MNIAIAELLAKLPGVTPRDPDITDVGYLAVNTEAALWLLEHVEDIRQALESAATDWIAAADALSIAAEYGVTVTDAALRKAAVTNGYIRYRKAASGKNQYDRQSVITWASNRRYHKAGRKSGKKLVNAQPETER